MSSVNRIENHWMDMTDEGYAQLHERVSQTDRARKQDRQNTHRRTTNPNQVRFREKPDGGEMVNQRLHRVGGRTPTVSRLAVLVQRSLNNRLASCSSHGDIFRVEKFMSSEETVIDWRVDSTK